MDAELTWSQAMVRTHQQPNGFSANHHAEDHFTTSLDVGDHIARVVLRRCLEAADRHGIAEPWIVDVGAGRGTLLRQLMALGFPRQRLLGVDVRARPADLEVEWVQGVAPGCVPRLAGLLFAHEFLDDVPADLVENGRVMTTAGTPGPLADPADVQWLRRWAGSDTGLVGRRRDLVWTDLVQRVVAGEAIAVDFSGGGPVGHRHGRQVRPVPDGNTDICAGVDMRSCRSATGGRILSQRRVLSKAVAQTVDERAELAVLRDPAGLGAFEWLITDVPSVGSPT